MSVSKWAYDPERCDGQPCPGDCDRCTVWQEQQQKRTAQAVKVIRCKDCGKRHNGCPLSVWCGPQDDDYCSRGVPKE